jgi:hypothetical protein
MFERMLKRLRKANVTITQKGGQSQLQKEKREEIFNKLIGIPTDSVQDLHTHYPPRSNSPEAYHISTKYSITLHIQQL